MVWFRYKWLIALLFPKNQVQELQKCSLPTPANMIMVN
jgi:hypothetical protein